MDAERRPMHLTRLRSYQHYSIRYSALQRQCNSIMKGTTLRTSLVGHYLYLYFPLLLFYPRLQLARLPQMDWAGRIKAAERLAKLPIPSLIRRVR